MFNVGGGELLVILLIALIVLGPQRLPDAARQVGKVLGEVRRVSSGFQSELKEAFDVDGADTTPRRTSPAPLAATVAEVEARPTAGSLAAGADRSPDEPSVAPAVVAALDEIVAPVDPAPGEVTPLDQASDERAAS